MSESKTPTPEPMTPERARCGTPCLKHHHDCDRSPRHTGWHRDVQQKRAHTCEWDTPGPKDAPAILAALRGARVEVGQLGAALDVTEMDLRQERTVHAQTVDERDNARADVKHLSVLARNLNSLVEKLRAESKRLAEQAQRVRDEHSPWRIYGECGHRHEMPDTVLGVQDIREVGLVCADGYDYTVCRACCCDADGNQTLECVENHSRECHPCPVIRTLDGTEAGR